MANDFGWVNRWSVIAAQLPGRTDNDIKNYWNTRLKKKLLGKHRKEHHQGRSCRGKNKQGVNNKGILGNSSFLPENSTAGQAHQQHHPFWPHPHPYMMPYTSSDQVPGFNDQDSIRKLLIKLGGTFSNYYQPDHDHGFNFQLPDDANSAQSPVYQVSSSASASTMNNNQPPQFPHHLHNYHSGVNNSVQGSSTFFTQAQEEMCVSYPSNLDGFEYFINHYDKIDPTSSCVANNVVCPPLLSSHYDQCLPTPQEFAFQEFSYPGAH